MYKWACDLNEAPYLECVAQTFYQHNDFYYNVLGSIQEPPFDLSIPPYLIICKQDQPEIDLYTSDIKICRLYMDKPEYLDSEYDTEKYRLTNDEISQLILHLNQKYCCNVLNNRMFDRFWDYLLHEYNRIYEKDMSNYIDIPNYFKLL